MSYIRKVDDNQAEIVQALRDAGASVQPIHTIGRGCPDLLVAFRNCNYVFEVKDGRKPPSARVLTDDEVRWHREWNGPVEIVSSIDEALRAIGVIV
jgi:hypothetical protein